MKLPEVERAGHVFARHDGGLAAIATRARQITAELLCVEAHAVVSCLG